MPDLPAAVDALLQRFERNRAEYLSPDYLEARVRNDFINPFFRALGWDMDNRLGVPEYERDVITEDRLRIGGGLKAPDYMFRLGGVRQFIVEAKRPSENLRSAAVSAQLRVYGWNAKEIGLGVLTNFRQLAIYDCRVEPSADDTAAKGRLDFFEDDDLRSRWDDIVELISRDAVGAGSLDRYRRSTSRRGRQPVDRAFLSEIETWREQLAKNLARRNTELTQAQLNEAVQKIIDRVVFLRICEDRNIEDYGQLRDAAKEDGIYPRLVSMFKRADDKYNSGLFHFSAERGRPTPPDRWTTALDVDDKALRPIINRLYWPTGPYDFRVFPPDILGQVYEQFLGKVIVLRGGHRAEVEEKPEVRKAGGVYYTPTYVVDHIVEEAVAPLLQGLSPKQASGEREGRARQRAPIRVCDPACGSGSFLIAAYQYLLDWYLDAYIASPAKWSRGREPRLREVAAEEWRLTTQERKRILLTHIYGVDIDPSAVEVSKLSLLLKVLEGETEETISQQLRLFQERALPDLDSNVRCGNSLIAPDFIREQQSLLSQDDRRKANPFKWEDQFPEVFTDGGFSAVIGNPPYVLLQDELRDEAQLAYFRSHYRVASYKIDTYHLFMERGLSITKKDGRFSMITPANFLTNNNLVALRTLLLSESQVERIFVIDGGVFEGIAVDNAIFVVRVGGPTTGTFDVLRARAALSALAIKGATAVSASAALESPQVLFTASSDQTITDTLARIGAASSPLSDFAFVNFGKQLRDRRKFARDVIDVGEDQALPRGYKRCYTGRDVHAWLTDYSGWLVSIRKSLEAAVAGTPISKMRN